MADFNMTPHYGKDLIPSLAELYKQLYIRPAEDALETYKDVVLAGEEPPSRSLSHFIMHEQDSVVYEETPAGPVLAVTLNERQDFETFLQIIANKCMPVTIPATQGATLLDGVISWNKINARKEAYLNETAGSGEEADWSAEFARFTSVKTNYTDVMLVLSTGPYSAVNGSEFGIDEEQWRKDSVVIRKYHELNHFICRKCWPEKISAVWDELVADAVGIYAAYGTYDLPMAERFLGIRDNAYTGGRLENYVDEEDPAKKKAVLDRLAERIHPILCSFEELIRANSGLTPFELIPVLEDRFKGDVSAD